MGKKITEIELVKGNMPKKGDKTTYDWEPARKKQLEPWHLTSISLLLDVLVLVVYSFVNFTRTQLLLLGYTSHLVAIGLIVLSYGMLKHPKKKWSQPVIKFSSMINMTAIFITAVVTLLTLLLT